MKDVKTEPMFDSKGRLIALDMTSPNTKPSLSRYRLVMNAAEETLQNVYQLASGMVNASNLGVSRLNEAIKLTKEAKTWSFASSLINLAAAITFLAGVLLTQ